MFDTRLEDCGQRQSNSFVSVVCSVPDKAVLYYEVSVMSTIRNEE